ncbi:MAG: SDR family oxidoreductase [Cloacibacterium sp.]|nr:SDR family oxidoreductase [Cloacibacterium sp.]
MSLSSFSLHQKTILITGASSGIGKTCAIECSKAGAQVILVGRNTQRLIETQIECKGETYTVAKDISSCEELEELLMEINHIKKIDGIIHSAGKEVTLPFKKSKKTYFQDIFDINVFSGFELTRLLLSNKKIEGAASIVFISSAAALVGEPGKVIYSASKGALLSGAKSLAMELSKQRIRVNTITPAIVNTPLVENMFENIGEEATEFIKNKHPFGLGDSKDVAMSCIFLLSDASKWITGTNIVLDGGYTSI